MRLPIRPKPTIPKFLFEKEFLKKSFLFHSPFTTDNCAFEQFLFSSIKCHQAISGVEVKSEINSCLFFNENIEIPWFEQYSVSM